LSVYFTLVINDELIFDIHDLLFLHCKTCAIVIGLLKAS